MKLWNKANTDINQTIEAFTVGNDKEMDLYLARYDVLGTMAHVKMLQSVGLLSKKETAALLPELAALLKEIDKGRFVIEEGVEDVHSQIELLLTLKLGQAGKKIHSARSRNDQVLVDIKLFIRDMIRETVEKSYELFKHLLHSSDTYKDALLPGYTHLQVAMPSSFGLWFGAYAEAMVDDMTLLRAAYKINNQNPLGSAAGYGTSFPIDRQLTTELLGFETQHYNVICAQMGRGKNERSVSFAIAALASTLSKLATDVCLFMSQNFGFVGLPDELTTGSSIMPHKKNPDVFELIRARCNKLQSLPGEVALITNNLPSGYFRDMQILKETILPAFDELLSCLHMTTFMVQHIKVNTTILEDPKYQYLFSVEEVNKLVLAGLPFREAYQQVGRQIEEGTFQPDQQISHTHEGSIGNLCNDKINKKMQAVVKEFNFYEYEQALARLSEGT